MKKGERVGAIRDGDGDTINLYGFGVYEGDQKVPTDIAWYEGQINPRIKLDDGRVVWGMQCWWGAEDKIKERIKDSKINIV